MHSVKYDSTELVNSTYNLEYSRDHSAPPRDFTLVPYATDDGSVVVFDKYGIKHIVVKGFIKAATPAALQIAVDAFKELFSRRNKNLDITPLGGTLRRYVANCVAHTLVAEHYNNTFLPYEAEFIVPLGIGKATATTEIYNASLTANHGAVYTLSVGSSPEQKLKFTLTFTTAAAIAGVKIRIYNDATPDLYDTAIIVTKNAFSNADVLIVDADAKTVTIGGTAVDYYGTFPRAILGTNKTKIVITFTQIIIEQHGGGGAESAQDIYDVLKQLAQSFMVKHTDDTYRTLRLEIAKTGAPPDDLTITIEGDNDGKPDGVAVATFTVTAGSLTGGGVMDVVTVDAAANFSLTGNTRYWIVFNTINGDAANKYGIYVSTTDTYSKGNWATFNFGADWVNDFTKDLIFLFRFGGKVTGAYSVATVIDYYPRYL